MLATRKKDYKGLRCIVSGKGNVSQYTIEKITQLGWAARPCPSAIPAALS